MANRQALRDLQSRLAQRLQAARTQERSASWLAVESAGQGLLLPLHEAGEIFPISSIMSVPHTASWFLGVANLRGGLYGVADLALFLGAAQPTLRGDATREQARLVGLNSGFEVNCALLVERLMGLRGMDQLTLLPSEPTEQRPAFVGQSYQDGQGRTWLELRLAALAAQDDFLRIQGRAQVEA